MQKIGLSIPLGYTNVEKQRWAATCQRTDVQAVNGSCSQRFFSLDSDLELCYYFIVNIQFSSKMNLLLINIYILYLSGLNMMEGILTNN